MNNSVSKKAHFIGIGGIGMSGIARLFLSKGIQVSGSDLKKSRITDELNDLGASIFVGHDLKNIQDVDTVIYSSAIKSDNPEILEAKRLKIRLIKRAEALAELMKDKTVITVTGSHGKTTTTSLVSFLLMEAGLCPTVAIGGVLRNIEKNAFSGLGEFFVAEADESDGSFLYYKSKYSIITNIDREHLDYYKSFENEIKAFKEFLTRIEDGGCVFCCGDDLNLKAILKDYSNKYILFGLNSDSDIYPGNIKIDGLTCEFDCFYKGKFIDRFYLALGGQHNISNALSVIALGLEIGVDKKAIKRALSNYKGAARRIEIKFKDNDYLLIDDYAHHPTEIKATLSAISNINGKRVIAVFQPHRYTRTKILLEEFTKCFDLAEIIVITDIYPASEPPIEGITGEYLSKRLKGRLSNKEVYFFPKEKLAESILNIIRPNDLVITLGAGDILKVSDELVKTLKSQSKV